MLDQRCDTAAEPLAGSGSLVDTALSIAFRQRPLDVEDTTRDSTLSRKLNALDLTLLGIGASIGSGIFVILGVAVKGTGPAVCFSFLLAAVGCTFSACCYAEMAARIPVSGSVYLYASVAFGEFIAVLFGLNLLVDYHVGAALGALSCGEYIRMTLEEKLGLNSMLPDHVVIAVILLAAITALLCLGVEHALQKVNGALVWAKVGIVVLIIGVGVTKMKWVNVTPLVPFGWSPVLSTSAMVSFSYIGFDAVANTAEECNNPNRDLPIGILSSLSACAVLYFFFAIVICGVIPFTEMDKGAPVVEAFGPRYANVPWVEPLVNWGAILGVATTLVAGLYSQARVYLAISRDGLLPSRLASIHSQLGTPVPAQLLCGFIAIVLAATLPLEKLAHFLNIGVLSSYALVCSGVLVLRAAEPVKIALGCAACTAISIIVSALAMHVPEWGPIQGSSSSQFLAYLALLAMLLSGWMPLLRGSYTQPQTFRCPLCPLVPILGITTNGYMLSQCHWEAWMRLLGTTLAVAAGYVVRVRTLQRQSGQAAHSATYGCVRPTP